MLLFFKHIMEIVSMTKLTVVALLVLVSHASLYAQSGKKVFETYCWGCHHQSAEAFGPSFTQIASHRSSDEIRAMITDPDSVSKVLGYPRNAMPPFKLTIEEMDAITAYILSFKLTQQEQ